MRGLLFSYVGKDLIKVALLIVFVHVCIWRNWKTERLIWLANPQVWKWTDKAEKQATQSFGQRFCFKVRHAERCHWQALSAEPAHVRQEINASRPAP